MIRKRPLCAIKLLRSCRKKLSQGSAQFSDRELRIHLFPVQKGGQRVGVGMRLRPSFLGRQAARDEDHVEVFAKRAPDVGRDSSTSLDVASAFAPEKSPNRSKASRHKDRASMSSGQGPNRFPSSPSGSHTVFLQALKRPSTPNKAPCRRCQRLSNIR